MKQLTACKQHFKKNICTPRHYRLIVFLSLWKFIEHEKKQMLINVLHGLARICHVQI